MEGRERLSYPWSVESKGDVDSNRDTCPLLPLSIILTKAMDCAVTKHRLWHQRPRGYTAFQGMWDVFLENRGTNMVSCSSASNIDVILKTKLERKLEDYEIRT